MLLVRAANSANDKEGGNDKGYKQQSSKHTKDDGQNITTTRWYAIAYIKYIWLVDFIFDSDGHSTAPTADLQSILIVCVVYTEST